MINYKLSELRVPSPLNVLPYEKRREAWQWLKLYADKVIAEIRLFGWTLARVRLRDLFPIFAKVIGPEPVGEPLFGSRT